MDKQSTIFPTVLFVGGVLGSLYLAALIVLDFLAGVTPYPEMWITLAAACVAAAIGWNERHWAEDFNETFYGE